MNGMNRIAGRSEDSVHGAQTQSFNHILKIVFILSKLLMSSPVCRVLLPPTEPAHQTSLVHLIADARHEL